VTVENNIQRELDIEHALVMPFGLGDHSICTVCRAVIHEPRAVSRVCENCLENASSLDGISTPILPISLYTRDSVLRTWLTHYKPDIDSEHGEIGESPSFYVAAMWQLFSRFFESNPHLLENADAALVVPSTRRSPPHPLEEIISSSPARNLLRPGALTRTKSSLDHRQANMLAYDVSDTLAGQRVLIIDDVYASGARLQSAAAAVRRCGGTISGAVVAARRINPGYHPSIEARWNAALNVPFSWAR
jgi:predicted amidophosphoribosyltransferase